MKIKLLYSCLLLAATAGSAFAQDTPDPAMVQKIREEGLNHSKVMDFRAAFIWFAGLKTCAGLGGKRAENLGYGECKARSMG
jgi:carboxypeptidase Q